MMTVQNPGGTPSVTYNRDGATISSYSAAGTTQAAATQIVRYSGTTIAICTASSSQRALILPASPEIGDVVEVYPSSTSTPFTVYPQSGAAIGYGGANSPVFSDSQGGMRFVYLASNLWGVIVSA